MVPPLYKLHFWLSLSFSVFLPLSPTVSAPLLSEDSFLSAFHQIQVVIFNLFCFPGPFEESYRPYPRTMYVKENSLSRLLNLSMEPRLRTLLWGATQWLKEVRRELWALGYGYELLLLWWSSDPGLGRRGLASLWAPWKPHCLLRHR